MTGRAENGQQNAKAALIVALAGGANVREACRQTRHGERTVHRWLKDPAFTAQVSEARLAALEAAAATRPGGVTWQG